MTDMRTVRLPAGERVAALGLGTWQMAGDRRRRGDEISTVREALDLGMTVIDTAEMYGEGAVEELLGEALAGRRDQAFLVSKVYPHNASRDGAVKACERSLRRLQTDRLDLYLLHWRGSVPLDETLAAFEALRRAGKIRHFGVSNLDAADMRELWSIPAGRACQANQVLYNLNRRGIEWDLLPWCRQQGLPLMAYSPIDQGKLATHAGLVTLAQQLGATAIQLALAWLLRQDDIIVIPKTSRPERLREIAGYRDLRLDSENVKALDRLFAPPKGPRPLEII